jgi:hypothetical protein
MSKWEDLPDVITPLDLMKVLPIGEATARNMFNAEDFPRIKHTGVKQIADKEAVRYWCMGLDVGVEVVNKILEKIDRGVKTND